MLLKPDLNGFLLFIIKGHLKRFDRDFNRIALWVQQDGLSWIVAIRDVHLNEKAARKTRANQLLCLIYENALSHQPDLERDLCDGV